jgi:hypothetical protein
LSALGVVKYGQYTFQVVNTAAAEGWNSYLQAFPANRSLRLIATNWTEVCLYDASLATVAQPLGQPLFIPQPLNPNLPLTVQNPLVLYRTSYALQVGNVVGIGTTNTGYKSRWDAQEYIPALNTNTTFGLVYNPVTGRVFPLTETNNLLAMFPMTGTRLDRLVPKLNIAVTNRLVFAIVDYSFIPPRLLDFVNLKSGTLEKDILENLVHTADGPLPGNTGDAGIDQGFDNTGGNIGGGAGSVQPLRMADLWQTNFLAGRVIPSGFENQFSASLNPLRVLQFWEAPVVPGVITTGDPRLDASLGLRAFLYGINSVPRSSQVIARREMDRLLASGGSVNGNRIQVGFNPVGEVHLTDRRMANDPQVHYTKEDLQPGGVVYTHPEGYWKFYTDVYFDPKSLPPFDRRPEYMALDPGISEGRIAEPSGDFLVTYVNRTNRVPAPSKFINAYAPWGVSANLGTGVIAPDLDVDMAYKDPLVLDSRFWSFPNPTTAFASIGQLGRIHRGTPWQTIYLKSLVANLEGDGKEHIGDRHHWKWWSGSYGTHPTNDWALLDIFSTALTENAGRGQIGVNQTNLSAWSAILAGVPVIQNQAVGNKIPWLKDTFDFQDRDSVKKALLSKELNAFNKNEPSFLPYRNVGAILSPSGAVTNSSMAKIFAGNTVKIDKDNAVPNTSSYLAIVNGFTHTNLIATSSNQNKRVPRRSLPRFVSVGEICSIPTLSVGSPLLDDAIRNPFNPDQPWVPDEVVERIPQQILSLLKAEEPRYVIYAWAQTLKPAPGAVVTAPGPFFGLSTNYVVTGEFATKTVLRFEGALSTNAPVTQTLRSVVEDHRVLTTD